VVVVITGACPAGEGCAPPAISPAMCAMSATRIAPVSAAISRTPGSRWSAGSPCPAEDHLGPFGAGQIPDLVQVEAAGVGPDPVLDRAEPLAGHRDRPAVGEVPAIAAPSP